MNRRQLVFTLFLCLFVSAAGMAQGTRLLRHPKVSRELVAFEYAGDLWAVSRSGGQARRLTSTPGVEIDPFFSPDGSQIAFSATVAGNTDVYIMPAAGGDPKSAYLSSRRRSVFAGGAPTDAALSLRRSGITLRWKHISGSGRSV